MLFGISGRFRLPLPFFLAMSVYCCGCGRTDPLNRQFVDGRVTLMGEPAPAGMIEFVSPQFMSGAPIRDGEFRIKKELGIPPGEYLIRIYVPDLTAPRQSPTDGPGEFKVAKERVPDEFNIKSEVRCVVEAGKRNRFEFDIPRPRM